jgi:2,4-dienoyl-CoA reductase-like NADH-dependent reductase (Old Yellow Enzyme family)
MMEGNVRPRLFSPGRMGRMELRNRVVMAPMVVQLGSESGAVTDRTVEYYARRAAGGVSDAAWQRLDPGKTGASCRCRSAAAVRENRGISAPPR